MRLYDKSSSVSIIDNLMESEEPLNKSSIPSEDIKTPCVTKVINKKDNEKLKKVKKNKGKEPEQIKTADIKQTPLATAQLVGEELAKADLNEQLDIPFIPEEPDYNIEDITEPLEIETGDVRDIKPEENTLQDLLVKVDQKLQNKLGESYGHINIFFTRRAENPTLRENALIEYIIGGKHYMMSVILKESDGVTQFSVTDTMGKEKYRKKTKNPVYVMESFFTALRAKVLINESVDIDTEYISSHFGRIDNRISDNEYIIALDKNLADKEDADYVGDKWVDMCNHFKEKYPKTEVSDNIIHVRA